MDLSVTKITRFLRRLRPRARNHLENPYNPESATIDFVFVHAERNAPWIAPYAQEPWPNKLPAVFPTARILIFEYNAEVEDKRGISEQTFDDHTHARELLDFLSVYRKSDAMNKRPITFICHGLGKLVCYMALTMSTQRRELYLHDLWSTSTITSYCRTSDSITTETWLFAPPVLRTS
ncbi:hypothetical protein BDV33DRAFT_184392 [Aspergillus novoparasiticus]|uniref:Uncharacterized protein n=1 Tax=Aspergillus novoparasiticus TaxID=986946 RepID=A0A5N6E8D0_9EURO|nr:hypothetical protein BDV33DRAFT_184392 [Aspergillus novoparasiticus]